MHSHKRPCAHNQIHYFICCNCKQLIMCFAVGHFPHQSESRYIHKGEFHLYTRLFNCFLFWAAKSLCVIWYSNSDRSVFQVGNYPHFFISGCSDSAHSQISPAALNNIYVGISPCQTNTKTGIQRKKLFTCCVAMIKYLI